METKLYVTVLNNFEILFESKKNYDVIIQAGEGQNQKEIYAHSVVLRCQSNYFDTAFSTSWAERKNGRYIFKKPNISPQIFEIILRYLYCGQIDLNVKNASGILQLLVATDEFGLQILCEYIQEFLIENQKEFLQYDLVEILEIVFQHETFTKLKVSCLKIICQKPDILFGTDKISSLSAQVLESFLLQEDLALKEIDVWDNLIKWSYAQHPTIDYDPSKWKKEDIVLIENTISRFIPLIRFHDITSEDYFNKVLPYQSLLPETLKNEILQFYLVSGVKRIGSLPSRSFCRFDSDLINANHVELFTSWIRKRHDVLKRTCKFNLILRGSRDGFDPTAFHTRCNNKGATIVIVKIKGTNQIVGGYNPLDWAGNCGYKNTRYSFIYSFENYKNINTGKIGKVIKPENAVVCNNSYGPCFGNYNENKHSNDLTMTNSGKWSSATNTYPNLNIPRRFEIEDYEVFQVI